MATPQGGLIKEFTAGAIARITGNLPGRALVTVPKRGAPAAIARASAEQLREAFTPAQQFFPAGVPLTPVAPAGIAGRARDFSPFINMAYTPRSEPGDNAIGFTTLQRMASPAEGGLDLLRLAIETRKDQMAGQRWSIRGKAKNDDGGARARQFEAWLARPDGVHTFRQWMRMLLEDHFVIDAPTIYYSGGTDRPRWEIVDGATIKLLITGDDGRTPLPPLPAYQQILVGLPAVEYTTSELGYYAYNLLPRRMYGMSRVEQCLVTIRIALERAVSQLSYYTEGTTPDGFMELPKDFTLEQVQQWTEWFNAELSGQSHERHKIRFVLQDSKYTATKSEILKDSFDEWLARIVCYCFSLPPSALVKETNRSTANTTKESAQEEGLEPTKLWFKDVMDDILVRSGDAGLEWQWEDEEIVDPAVKATVVQTYFGGATGASKPIVTLAEARAMIGLPPATPEQLAELQPPEPEPTEPTDPAANGEPPDDDARPPKKRTVTKAGRVAGGRALPPLTRNTKLVARTARRVQVGTRGVLVAQHAALSKALIAKAEKVQKLTDADDLTALLREIQRDTWDDDAREKLWTALAALSEDRQRAALAQLEEYTTDDRYAAALVQANERAVEWARFRTTNMITAVNDTTRQLVNELAASAIEDGLTNAEFAGLLADGLAFGDSRAMLIARTETAFAETAGTLEGYKASDVVERKGWSADADACDDCATLDGVEVDLDEDFPENGGDGPPAHPRCECAVYPVLAEGLIVSD